jgi:S-adenosylmethionine:diacylglycerol 3-amino-3-carboxypropyl transferase
MEALPGPTAAFWRLHAVELCLHGAIWCARYEQFIKKLHIVIRPLLGRAFTDLARCATTAEQELIFDRRIGRAWLRMLLRLAFSRRVYSGHGVDEQGLANRRTTVPLGEQYWTKLRCFCTAALARQNPWLQIHTIGHLLSLEAAPYYLGDGFSLARRQVGCVDWVQSDLLEYVKGDLPADVTRVFLSNLPDWCSPIDFEQLLCELVRKLPPESRVLWSYLHTDAQVPAGTPSLELVESEAANADRFPFYAYTCARVAGPANTVSGTK